MFRIGFRIVVDLSSLVMFLAAIFVLGGLAAGAF